MIKIILKKKKKKFKKKNINSKKFQIVKYIYKDYSRRDKIKKMGSRVKKNIKNLNKWLEAMKKILKC